MKPEFQSWHSSGNFHGLGVYGMMEQPLKEIVQNYRPDQVEFTPVEKISGGVELMWAMHYFPPAMLFVNKTPQGAFLVGVGTTKDQLEIRVSEMAEVSGMTLDLPVPLLQLGVHEYCRIVAQNVMLLDNAFPETKARKVSLGKKISICMYAHFLYSFREVPPDIAMIAARSKYDAHREWE